MKSESSNIYCFDSSALIWINRYYPSRLIPDLWLQLEELFKHRKIISHDIVYGEIVPTSGTKDEIAKLGAKYKSSFLPITNVQGQLALQILTAFPRLIDPNLKKDQADPWIVALVIERMQEQNLFGKDSEYVVVSTEKSESNTKIPAVCKHFKVRHMYLFEFCEDNNWQVKMSYRT